MGFDKFLVLEEPLDTGAQFSDLANLYVQQEKAVNDLITRQGDVVTRQGDLQMVNAGAGTSASTLAFDILGPEIGASSGQTTRYRGFFLVDRTQLTGYDPNVVGSFRPAVVYRQTIE